MCVYCIHADALGRTGEALTPSADASGHVRLRDAGLGIERGVVFNLTTGQPHAVVITEERECVSEAFSAVSAGSTSDSNKPDTTSRGSARPTSGAGASSQPDSPESNAAPTSEVWAIEAVGRKMSGGPEVGLGIRNDGTMYTLDRESHHAVSISSAVASPAKTSVSPADAPASSAASDRASSLSAPASQMSFYDQEAGSSLRTYPDSFPQTVDAIMPSFSRRWPTSGSTTSPGECWTHDSSESPSGGGVSSSLRDVLEDHVAERYFLSPKAAAGILRRAEKRGRELPPHLLAALRVVAESTRPDDARRTT